MILRTLIQTCIVVVASVSAAAAPLSRSAACPVQPEPAALSSADFDIPTSGEVVLFSAAPSFLSVRYALRIERVQAGRSGRASLIRLQRRRDCNVHDRTGEWEFKLTPGETDSIFGELAAMKQAGSTAEDIVLDGTAVEVQSYARGERTFGYTSNGPAKENLSAVILGVIKKHVPASDLPNAPDWRYSRANR